MAMHSLLLSLLGWGLHRVVAAAAAAAVVAAAAAALAHLAAQPSKMLCIPRRHVPRVVLLHVVAAQAKHAVRLAFQASLVTFLGGCAVHEMHRLGCLCLHDLQSVRSSVCCTQCSFHLCTCMLQGLHGF
jgi:hypothetical protein